MDSFGQTSKVSSKSKASKSLSSGQRKELANLIGFLDTLIQIDLIQNHRATDQTNRILKDIIVRDSNE